MPGPHEQCFPGQPAAGDETATLLGSPERRRATFAWKGHVDLIRVAVDGLADGDPPEPAHLHERLAIR